MNDSSFFPLIFALWIARQFKEFVRGEVESKEVDFWNL